MKAISECPFFQIPESAVWDLMQWVVTKDFQVGLVIHSDDEIIAAKDKVSSPVQGISHS